MNAEGSDNCSHIATVALGQQKDKGERGNGNERAEHQAGTDSSGVSHQAGWGS